MYLVKLFKFYCHVCILFNRKYNRTSIDNIYDKILDLRRNNSIYFLYFQSYYERKIEPNIEIFRKL